MAMLISTFHNNTPIGIVFESEDLIESQPVSKELHDWQQSTIEAEHMIDRESVEN